MRKYCLSFLIFAFVLFPAFPETTPEGKKHHFAFSVSLGMLSGKINETVFYDRYTDDKLSELTWELKPLYYAGLDLHYKRKAVSPLPDFFTDIGLKFGIPGKTGMMEDRDWYYNDGVNEYGTYPYWLTFYSEHENKINAAILADITIGPEFGITRSIALRAFIFYGFMFYSWEASGGSRLYPGDHNYWSSDKRLITYRQFWHIFSPGLSLSGNLNRRFSLEISVKLSTLVWISAEDNHILRDLIIIDEPSGGLFVEPGFVFSLKTSPLFTVSLVYSYRRITGSRGDSYYETAGHYEGAYEDAAGADHSVHNFGVLARFNVSGGLVRSR